MKKTMSVFMTVAMAASVSFALPRKAAEFTVSGFTSTATLRNFPVLVRISPERISGFSYADCAADGRDIAFRDAQGNALAREIDTWDPNGESLVWVSIPSFASNVVFTMTYKDPSVSEQPACQTDGSVWAAAAYLGVWHFGEDSGAALDSSPNSLDGTVNAGYEEAFVATADAKVGKGRYVPQAAYLNLPNFSHLDLGNTLTLSGWYKFDPANTLANSTSPMLFYAKTAWNSTTDGWYVCLQWTTNSDTTKKTLGINGAGTTVQKATIDSMKSAWVHVTAVFNGNKGFIYSNGTQKGTPTITPAMNIDPSLTPRMFTSNFAGFGDEIRLRRTPNDAAWVKAEYQTVAKADFLTCGAATTMLDDGAFGVAAPVVVENGGNSLSLRTDVFCLGASVPSATVKFLYGVSPDALVRTFVASSSATADGDISATITRLTPGLSYYVKAVAEENGGGGARAESATIRVQAKTHPDWPACYTPLDYIEGTGTEYIDTGYCPSPETRTVLDFQLTAVKGQYRLFGVEKEGAGNLVYSMYVNGTAATSGSFAYARRDNTGNWTALVGADTVRHIFDFNHPRASGGRAVTISDTTISNKAITDAATVSAPLPLKLGAGGSATATNLSKYRLYSCQLYEGDELVRDFIPARRDSDGAVGLYDFVEGVFHPSTGANPVVAIEATENVVNGALASVALSFPASDSARALCAAWGPAYRGDDLGDWFATNAVAAVAAEATTASWTPPTDWGSDSNLVVRFYFDGISPLQLSAPIYWRDYSDPRVRDVVLDSTGGDTLVVSGTLESFPGADCTLTVYVGDSPTTLTNAWTSLPGGVLAAPGDFSFALFEPDTASPRYFAPGGTYYITVQAASNGQVSRTTPVRVTMASAPAAFAAAPTATIKRRTLTFTGQFSDVGVGNASEVTVWYGDSNDPASFVQVGGSAVVSNTASFSIVGDLPAVSMTYYWRLRAVNTAQGGTYCVTNFSSVVSSATRDDTTYTWKDKNGDWSGDWNDPDHWDALPAADALDYPNSSYAKAVFPFGHHIEVMVDGDFTVGTLDLSAYDPEDTSNGIDVTFRGHEIQEGTVRRRLAVSTLLDLNGSYGSVVFDNLRVTDSGSGTTTVGPKRSLTFSGYSYYYKSNSDFQVLYGSQVAFCSATGSVHNLYLGYSGSTLTIDDSPITYRNECGLGSTSGGGNIVFKGAAPSLYSSNASQNSLYARNNTSSKITFHVPAGGYVKPPITCVAKKTKCLFAKNSKSGSITLAIAPESPCFASVGSFDTKLASWTGSSTSYYIDRSLLAYSAPDGSTFTFGTGSADEAANLTPAASFSGNAQSMGVRIVSAAHDGRITVATDAATALDGYSPALGTTDGYVSGDTVTLAAPTDVVSNNVHYVCTGYTLVEYAAGEAARPTATNTVTDGTHSFSYNFPAGRAEITWHYATSFPVTASTVNDAGGSVAVSAPYMTVSSPVTLTASTVTDGMEFQYWYGDLPYESRYANPLTLAADKAASVTAFFGATKENGAVRLASGGGGNNGATSAQWFAPATWTGGVIPGTNDIAVIRCTWTSTTDGYVSDGRNKRRYLAPSFVAVGGLVASNACLYVGVSDARYGTFSADQNGVRTPAVADSADLSRKEPIGLDVFGDVFLDGYNMTGKNCGGSIYVGGKGQWCQSRVEIAGDLEIRNGTVSVAAGYPYVLIPNYNCIASGEAMAPSLPFTHTNEFFRGGNYLRVKGDTIVRKPATTAALNYSVIHVLNDARTGAAVWLDLKDVTVEEGAAISSYNGGYMYFDGSGTVGAGKTYSCSPGGHGSIDSYTGGSHGGLGGRGNGNMDGANVRGRLTISDKVFDFEYSPLFPGNYNTGTGDSRGSGTIRLDCSTLTLDGALAATGMSGGKGGRGGGSIWVVCETFVPGENCSVKAQGGNLNCGGGGGRIAICEGLANEQVLALYETHEIPAGATASSLTDKLGSRASAAGGTANDKYSPGEDGTAVYIVNTTGKKTLVIAANPENVGTPTPAYGPQVFDDGEEVELVAPDNVVISADNRSMRLCDGYIITDTESGMLVAVSSDLAGEIAVSGDWTLTWQLTNVVHAITINATVGGSVTTNAVDDASSVWQRDGFALSFTAVPASGYVFKGWYGEVEREWIESATISFATDHGRDITALFEPVAPGARAWTGEGDGTSWTDPANWSPAGLPGVAEAVTIPDGAVVSASLCAPVEVGSLTIERGATLTYRRLLATATTRGTLPENASSLNQLPMALKVNGSLVVDGTFIVGYRNSYSQFALDVGGDFAVGTNATVTLYAGYAPLVHSSPVGWDVGGGRVRVGGALRVAYGAKVTPYCDCIWGAPVVFSVGSACIDEGGYIDAYAAGWALASIGGFYYSGSPNKADWSTGGYAGGTYGGIGGHSDTHTPSSITYGNPYAPYMPGSPGMNATTFYGGGVIRIDATGDFVLNGSLLANGYKDGNAGSGGSIWITAGRYRSGANAVVSAAGGDRTGNSGAGGGGRVCLAQGLSTAQIAQLYATGTCDKFGRLAVVDLMDPESERPSRVGGTVTARGGTNARTTNDRRHYGTDGTAVWLAAQPKGTILILQ